MNLISRNTMILSTSRARTAIQMIFCLALLVLVVPDAYSQQPECPRQAATVREVDLMDTPPTYSTKRGWVNGNKIGTIPRGIRVQICEERPVGFFGSKQLWFRIKWETRQGWIDSTGVEERRQNRSGFLLGFQELLFPVAYAQANSEVKPQDPPLFFGSFLSIVTGMIAKSLFDLFRKKRRWVGAKGFTVGLIPSLVVSPMVFLGFIKTADINLTGDLGIWVLFLFAFQNGFFWEDILNLGQTTEPKPMAKKQLQPAESE